MVVGTYIFYELKGDQKGLRRRGLTLNRKPYDCG